MTAINEREQRGILIAATSKLVKKGGLWLVPSQSGKGKYTVCPDKDCPHCSCPDHETTGKECKHIYAARIVIQRELFDDGSVVETRELTITETRKSYPQDWANYNRAQVNEKEQFQILLQQLCKGIQDRPRTPGPGRTAIPRADAIFAACFKVFSTVSSRRFSCDLKDACDKGYIGRCPHFNSVLNVFDDPDTYEILRALVEESAVPLKAIESHFSIDSSGFSGCRYDRWICEKYGTPLKQSLRAWCKAHVATGAITNVVAAVEVLGKSSSDTVEFPKLLATTVKRFDVTEVSADMAYSSHKNLCLVAGVGATPLIPFKSNATPAMGGLWAKMFGYFMLHRDEFLSRYHKRSNIESTFSMIKRKFGDSVRSKTDLAMRNEVLAKLVCHNLCCLISAMYEMGVNPVFWVDQAHAG
jgi:transposase